MRGSRRCKPLPRQRSATDPLAAPENCDTWWSPEWRKQWVRALLETTDEGQAWLAIEAKPSPLGAERQVYLAHVRRRNEAKKVMQKKMIERGLPAMLVDRYQMEANGARPRD